MQVSFVVKDESGKELFTRSNLGLVFNRLNYMEYFVKNPGAKFILTESNTKEEWFSVEITSDTTQKEVAEIWAPLEKGI